MNTAMWENPIVQENIEKLKAYGYEVLDTDTGRLACGDTGSGKLLPWEDIVKIILRDERGG
jgi:phosphopantothenoylcysteine decarboxylase/phosphopantothenate--cysteine ligase